MALNRAAIEEMLANKDITQEVADKLLAREQESRPPMVTIPSVSDKPHETYGLTVVYGVNPKYQKRFQVVTPEGKSRHSEAFAAVAAILAGISQHAKVWQTEIEISDETAGLLEGCI